MEILEQSEIFGSLKFEGANDVGPQLTMTLSKVMFTPSKALNMIGDDWGQLELEGEVLVVDGSFGQLVHPDDSLTSPDIEAHYIGKGVVSWKGVDDTDYRDVGNVPVFEFTPDVKRLDHFSSRLGVKSKDKSVVIEKSAKLRLVMDEWTAKNMQLALMAVND